MRMDEWRRTRTQGKEFFGGRRCQDCLSLFSVHLFRWVFLNRMYAGFSWAAGRPQAASLPHRTEMGILARFPWGVRILLRKTPPESKHGKQEQAVPAAPSAKKFLPLLGAVMCDLYVWFYNKKAKGSFAFCFFCYHTLGVRKNSGCPVCDWEMVF